MYERSYFHGDDDEERGVYLYGIALGSTSA